MYMLDDPPEEVRVLLDEARARLHSVDKKAPSSMAMTALAGIPRVRRGMKAPPVAALLAVSGPATPSIIPVPNFSGSGEFLFHRHRKQRKR